MPQKVPHGTLLQAKRPLALTICFLFLQLTQNIVLGCLGVIKGVVQGLSGGSRGIRCSSSGYLSVFLLLGGLSQINPLIRGLAEGYPGNINQFSQLLTSTLLGD